MANQYNAAFNTPLALAREPWTAAFFALCAPLLFPILVLLVAQAVMVAPGEQLALPTSWLLSCFAVALQFAVVSLWSDWLGAGPFAGAMRTSRTWLFAAIIIGPLLLNAPEQLVEAILGGNGDWIYRESYDPEIFAGSSQSLSFLFYVMLLAPIVEEVTYRGVAMGAMLSRGINPIAAAILASIAFTLPHTQYSPAALLVVFVTGLGLAALRLLSGTIIVPIIAHIAANAATFLL